MTKLVYCVLTFILLTAISMNAQVKSPADFMPHAPGEHFTPHHLLVDYYYHVAENSPLVKVVEYGRTNQSRPMILAFVTSEENHRNLENIRTNNLRMANVAIGIPDTSFARVITWLSYSVHGNEAAGSEAAPTVLYELAKEDNPRTKKWLENSVIIIDPSINPDGYERYTHWVRNVAGEKLNTDIQDIEHTEPWPGGRTNHYQFDLNRDWVWQTQVESQQRMQVYNQWIPHIHVDFHEMGHENPYYFAPAAKPYHTYISEWQQNFQETIGKNHAKYFDAEGWLYFTRESFDLFYPSYGDTYPTFTGGIGMTYEQGGGSVGGRAVKLKNGEILSLKDRIEHHVTTSLSTIEVGSEHSADVIREFKSYFDNSVNGEIGSYKTFVVKRDGTGQRVKALSELLKRQGIHFGTVPKELVLSGYAYSSRTYDSKMKVSPGDLVIASKQPMSVLAQILLNPSNILEDSLTYDITAWSLPYAFGLEALASEQEITDTTKILFKATETKVEEAYAYIVPWTDLSSAKAAAWLHNQGISVRHNTVPFTIHSHHLDQGALIITKADNRSGWDEIQTTLAEMARSIDINLVQIKTGWSESGPNLGSSKLPLVERPKVFTIAGNGVGSYDYGQVRWYFEQVLKYPLSTIYIDHFERTDLNKYNTLILPEGSYTLSKSLLEKLNQWVRNGGKVIAIGRALSNFTDKSGFGLKSAVDEKAKKKVEEEAKERSLEAIYDAHSDRRRNSLRSNIPGSLFFLDVDSTHPLGYGLGDTYISLRKDEVHFPLNPAISNVIRHPVDSVPYLGFSGSEITPKLKNTMVFGVEYIGRGKAVYMVDNPLYRGFWYNGLFLFGNALFQVD
jgi:hypothetical protein